MLGAEACWLGHGGIELVASASGVSRKTVVARAAELEAGEETLAAGRVRRKGGGRQPLSEADPGLVEALNWAGKPLTSSEVAVNLVAGTTTRTGLSVRPERDTGSYPRGITITDRQVRELERNHITRHDWHPDWNYTITPARAA